MSGGSLGYVYEKVEEAANTIRSMSEAPLHVALANHLELVAAALHDVEWVLSGDYDEGGADASIRYAVPSAGSDGDPYMTEEELSATEAEESAFDPEHPSNTGL